MSQSVQATIEEPKFTKARIKSAMHSKTKRNTVWCIVEGKNDKKLYERFFDHKKVKVELSKDEKGNTGRKNVGIIVTELTEEEPKCHIFGICDCDYTRYDSTYVCPPNVYLTDHRDIEMMMLEAPSVNKKLRKWNSMFSENIKNCLEPSMFLGYLRIYHHVKNFGYKNIKQIKISNSWDVNSHSLYKDWKCRLLSKFLAVFCDEGASEASFNDFVEEKQLLKESWLDVCRGHDFISLLGYMMVKHEFNDEDLIREKMTDSYSYKDFKTTRLYKSIKQWGDNKGITFLLD